MSNTISKAKHFKSFGVLDCSCADISMVMWFSPVM